MQPKSSNPRLAEFFAGIGLVRLALEKAGFDTVWANDIEPAKHALYAENFGRDEFLLGDVRDVTGDNIPDIELATASFPCTDLSLAGNRRGLAGEQSGMFWQFERILGEMGSRKPKMTLLENVPSFATSHGGADMRAAIGALNRLGYGCDPFVLNAATFVAQSRPRLFIVGMLDSAVEDGSRSPLLRPDWLRRFLDQSPDLRITTPNLAPPLGKVQVLDDFIERLHHADDRWWDGNRTEAFANSLAPIQAERLAELKRSRKLTWATAYRRTRKGRAVWEIRPDRIAGCLRTARGGSSKQAIVQAGRGGFRVRWMTPREYARLQGAGDDYGLTGVSDNQALFGLGDAVCVPAVQWIGQNYLRPALRGESMASDDVAA